MRCQEAAHHSFVTRLAFSNDSRRLATNAYGSETFIWDLDQKAKFRPSGGVRPRYSRSPFQETERLLALGTDDYAIDKKVVVHAFDKSPPVQVDLSKIGNRNPLPPTAKMKFISLSDVLEELRLRT